LEEQHQLQLQTKQNFIHLLYFVQVAAHGPFLDLKQPLDNYA
jgi:hypothetical protein